MKKILLILTVLIANVTWAQNETTTIYLIRHAEKANDGSADPGLSDAGKERTKRLGEFFTNKKVDKFYTTKYKRAAETASGIFANTVPYPPTPGTSLSTQFEVYDPMTFSLKDIAEKQKGKSILIVGHSNTIPTIVNNAIGETKYPDMTESEYGNLYIVTITDGRITHELVKM